MKKILWTILLPFFLLSCSTSEPDKQPPSIIYFGVSDTDIYVNQEVTLTWSVENASQVQIDNGIGAQAASGSINVKPTTTTTYILTATNADGSDTASAKINVRILLVSWIQSMTTYGCPQILGTIKNIGDKTIYNVEIDFSAYNNANTIIDTASGFPADLGNIPSDVSANFDAVFFSLYSWTQIDHVTYTINWINLAGFHEIMKGEIKF